MGDQTNILRAIRVIVVTTRAGVRSHQSLGTAHMIDDTVDRGLQLLGSLRTAQAENLSEAELQPFEEARRQILELKEEATATTPRA